MTRYDEGAAMGTPDPGCHTPTESPVLNRSGALVVLARNRWRWTKKNTPEAHYWYERHIGQWRSWYPGHKREA